jgi:hypothetical protein
MPSPSTVISVTAAFSENVETCNWQQTTAEFSYIFIRRDQWLASQRFGFTRNTAVPLIGKIFKKNETKS